MKQRPEPYEETIRRKAIDRVCNGESMRSLARALSISRTTVRRWVIARLTELGHSVGHSDGHSDHRCDHRCDRVVTMDVMSKFRQRGLR